MTRFQCVIIYLAITAQVLSPQKTVTQEHQFSFVDLRLQFNMVPGLFGVALDGQKVWSVENNVLGFRPSFGIGGGFGIIGDDFQSLMMANVDGRFRMEWQLVPSLIRGHFVVAAGVLYASDMSGFLICQMDGKGGCLPSTVLAPTIGGETGIVLKVSDKVGIGARLSAMATHGGWTNGGFVPSIAIGVERRWN